MDLSEKEVKVKKAKEKAKQEEKELRDSLRSQFVDLPYELREVEADYKGSMFEGKKIKVYYPILNTPKGYKKENERFYRKYANCIKHEYTLTDSQGRKVIIEELVGFGSKVYKSKIAYMELEFNIPYSNIEFQITMSEEEYRLKRLVNQKQLIKEIIGKDNIAKYIGFWIEDKYNDQEEKYNKLLETLGKTEKVPTLKELAELSNGDITKIQITDSISAIVEVSGDKTEHNVWFKNSMYSVRLDNTPTYSITVKMKPYLNETIKLEEQLFKYDELENEDELRKGKTFDELVELLETFQTK